MRISDWSSDVCSSDLEIDLPPIDLVLVSHNHYDHLDLATLETLWRRDRPRVITSLGNDVIIAKAGVPATAPDWGSSLAIKPGIAGGVTPAHHWTSRWFPHRHRAMSTSEQRRAGTGWGSKWSSGMSQPP